MIWLLKQRLTPTVCLLVIACWVAVGCQQETDVPELSTTVVSLDAHETDSFEQFRETVVPVLEASCALKCHGISSKEFEQFSTSSDHAGFFYFPFDLKTGRIPTDHASMVAAFHVTRGVSTDDDHGHTSGPTRIDYGEAPAFSHLIRAPLAVSLGGTPHRGLDVFSTTDDPGYVALLEWVETELALRPVEEHEVPKEEVFFRDNVLPALVRNGCFINSCHGPHAFNDLKYTLPLPSPDGKFDPIRDFAKHGISENRKQMLGAKSRLANLGGDLRLSRLLVKNLPISHGGVHQRGGNIQFFDSYDDPDVKIILDWLKLEKTALAEKLTSRDESVSIDDLGRLQAIAFIRGPRHQPRPFFDFTKFWPGSDIFLRPVSDEQTLEESSIEPANLTAQFHSEGPAEIQALDVRYDGRAIVFSMRTGADSGFKLYEIELDDNLRYLEGSFRQISFTNEKHPDGTLVHCIDPIYTPGPTDTAGTALDDVAVAFVTNISGDYAPSTPYALLGEADGGDEQTIIDAQRTETAGTFDSLRLTVVAGPNKGQWRTIVKHLHDDESVVGAKLQLDRPLPEPVDRRTVYTIEQKQASNLPGFDVWRCVPDKQSDTRDSFEETARRMTFTSAQERRLSMRSTGEVMFTSVRNVGFQEDRPVYNGAIFRVMAGGFDYHIQGGNRSRYRLFSDSRELPQGLEVRLSHDPRNLWGGGALMLADHGFGVHVEPENPVDDIPLAEDGTVGDKPLQSSSRRYLPALAPFFSETGDEAITPTGHSPGGSLRDPFPLPDGTILVSRVAESIDHLNDKADPNWDLYLLRFEKSLQNDKGNKVGPVKLVKIAGASSTEMAEYSPRPIVVRLKEKVRTHQKFATRNDDIKPEWVDGVQRMPDGLQGELECYDYPLLQSFLTHFAPVGVRDFRVGQEGPIAGTNNPDLTFGYVRIIAQVPPDQEEMKILQSAANDDPFATLVSQGVHTRKRIVTEIPLAADGTFYARVPTEVPLIVQGLNHNKMALHSMNRWFYLQPGEKLTFSIPRKIFPATCSGCHGALDGDAQHALGPPDVVSSASRVLATWDKDVLRRRPPFNAGQTIEDHVTVDFRRDVQPILDARCVSCHDGKSPQTAGLDLRGKPTKHYNVAYETLHMLREPDSGNHADKRLINEREALSSESYLIEKLLGRELNAPQELNTVGTPHPEKNGFSEQEMLTLIRWIDLGATFRGGQQTGEPADRSLVRTEEKP